MIVCIHWCKENVGFLAKYAMAAAEAAEASADVEGLAVGLAGLEERSYIELVPYLSHCYSRLRW